MILPIFITLILNSNSRLTKFGYTLVVIVSYLAFDLTYSRGGTIGLLAGLAVFFLFIRLKNIISNWRWLAAILAAVLLINVFFSNAFLARPVKIEQLNTDGTGIENTDSGQNRLVVWQGALEIAKHYPVFGSGVETFAYSYYQFRPKEHNLLSEWDVLFNKAHNEFLNYLATTGIVGFLSYLLLIFSFCWITIKYLIRDSSESLFKHLSNVAKLSPKPKHNSLKVPQQESNTQRLLVIALLSGYVSYHIQNIFGFSVVPIALFFYLFPAFVIIILEYKKDQNFQQQVSLNFLKKLPIPLSITKISIEAVIVIATIYFLASITTLWQADVYFAKGSRQQDYASLKKAADLNPDEPLYRSELSYLAAVMVSTQKNEVQKSNFIKEAEVEGEKAIQMSPLNVNYWKNLMRIYYELSKSNILYLNKAVEATVRAVELAPTDARLHFNLAWLYEETKQIDKAIKTQEETIYLKPDYKEAYFALASLYEKQQNKDKAISLLQKLTKFFPDDNEISGKIKSLKEHK
ncbi:O-antigen ligase family protein [Patescibacteria group bacterium]|nr:O-antigen ligase family protein [Patescibacteria group bacterium]